MTEEEYIVVSDLQRIRAADRLLRDSSSRMDLREIIDKLHDHISVLEKSIEDMMQS